MIKTLTGLLLALSATGAWATDLSPNQVGGGDIPGNYPSIDFYLSNGNWAPKLTLSNAAGDGYTVAIHSSAGYDSQLATGNTDYPLSSMRIQAGNHLSFVYRAARKQWSLVGPSLSPNRNGGSGTIGSYPDARVLRFDLADGDWAQAVTLPSSAPDNSLIVVSSSATWTSRINPQNIQYASSFNLRTGDQYAFLYRSALQRWVSVKAPTQTLDAGKVGAQIPTPSVPNTQVRFGDGNWVSEIRLPAGAGDRDRISLVSDATWTATVSSQNVDAPSTMKLFTGSRYDFIYIKERARWVLQSSPTPAYTASSPGGAQLPDMTSPNARYSAWDGNWTGTVKLPVNAAPGDRVVVKSDAAWDFSVTGQNTSFGSVPVRRGETLRFVRTSAGAWALDTRLITMLLVYSEEAAAQLGETAAQMRLWEGLRLTNEALENSRANFYVKAVGLLKRQFQATTLGDILNVALKDSVVSSTRSRLAADAVYYEGTEEGCGLAWVSAGRESMIGSGSLACGTTVMRHEFGHNMGLNHGDAASGGSAPYAKGYNLIRDIMGGNAIPFYSNPNLYYATPYYSYTPDTEVAIGLPMGIANVTDSVRAMNERSKIVSEFY
ncbi:metalloendopeptidase CpaA [Lysobacter sp. BMK333-48F3]|uniref:metalloendopeptidase CpaA n=1 Tax=Lysobacter sp. BMK333-48F3 TaxID=2867962 RepID=UPI001C8C7566|nr:metalloendopeptidase CpaA [Lysobacter sp. BMK333-48F3]